MLKCRDVAMQGSNYLDKRLSCRQAFNVNMHLLMCKHCRRFIRHLSLTAKVVSLHRFPVTSTPEADEIVNAVISETLNRAPRPVGNEYSRKP